MKNQIEQSVWFFYFYINTVSIIFYASKLISLYGLFQLILGYPLNAETRFMIFKDKTNE
jgi:hypothetical protein